MNKKIIYSLVLTSIFVMSIASVCIPVAGDTNWKFGVPDAAKGMKLQSEVKVYDKDVWGDCLGTCADQAVNEKYGGDGTAANDVGARSQSEISDWESDEVWLFGDYLMTSDVPLQCDGSKTEFGGVVLSDYWSAAVTVEEVLRELGTLNCTRDIINIGGGNYVPTNAHYYNPAWGHGKVAMLESIVAAAITGAIFVPYGGTQNLLWLLGGSTASIGSNESIWQTAMINSQLFEASTYTRAEISARYSKTYKATVIERDTWDFALDLESDPDEEDAEAPFIKDPEDLYDSFKYFNGFLNDEFALLDAMIYSIVNLNATIHAAKNYPVQGMSGQYAFAYINATLGNVFDALLEQKYGAAPNPYFDGARQQMITGGFYVDCIDTFTDVLLNADGTHPMQSGSPGLMQITPFFIDETPQQGREYLDMLLGGGLPAHQPVDKWLSDLIDLFDIDADLWVGDNLIYYPDITLRWIFNTVEKKGVPITDDLFRGKVEVDGLVVTLEWEWPEGFMNNKGFPSDIEERDDYEIVYTYGDTGGQSKTEYYTGDTLFYEIEGIAPTIVGYEVSILLGAAAIATLGLIFVVIKKRRM